MNPVLQTDRLSKRYGRHQALTDVTLSVPAGRIVGLVGPNGAGKSTLLNLASGMIAPTSGTIEVLGGKPGAQLAKVGFVAQDTPVYAGLSVRDHLKLGARLNPRWDGRLAQQRITQLGLDPTQKAGKLSGGQRAQLALTIAAAKRPELLIFDEPVASLDPLARRAFLQNLMEFVAELEVSVILSSHLIGDLERVCDHLIVLATSRVQVAGDVDDLLAAHYRLIGARGDFDSLPAGIEVVQAEHNGRQSTLIVRDTDRRRWQASAEGSTPATGALPGLMADVERLGLEDLLLAYLTRAATASVVSHSEMPLEAHR